MDTKKSKVSSIIISNVLIDMLDDVIESEIDKGEKDHILSFNIIILYKTSTILIVISKFNISSYFIIFFINIHVLVSIYTDFCTLPRRNPACFLRNLFIQNTKRKC